jgi:hypothetical protein
MRRRVAAVAMALAVVPTEILVTAQSVPVPVPLPVTAAPASDPTPRSLFGAIQFLQIRPELTVRRPSGTAEPADCAMVKLVDPAFRSNMPVVKPNPKVHYSMRVVEVPSCTPSPEVVPSADNRR